MNKFLYFFIVSFFIIKQSFANNIVVVDLEKIVKESSAAKIAAQKIDKQLQTYQNKINQKGNALKEKETALLKQSNVLSKAVFDKKKQELIKEIEQLEKEIQLKKESLDQAYVKALKTIQNEVNQIITEIATKNNFSIVIPKSTTLFSNQEVDISNKVSKSLNKRLPNVKIDFL